MTVTPVEDVVDVDRIAETVTREPGEVQ